MQNVSIDWFQYLPFQVNKKKKRKICEICSKLTIAIPGRRQWCHSGAFIDSFEHISHFFLLIILSNLRSYLFVGHDN